MSAPTGNIRGQRTQSSTSGYKTIGSSIASGNTSGAFKRIFINALGTSNGDFNLALTKTLKIPKHYYNNTSNSVYYQQPTLSGKRVPIYTSPSAITLTQVYQNSEAQLCSTTYESLSNFSASGTITSGNYQGQTLYYFSNTENVTNVYNNIIINSGEVWYLNSGISLCSSTNIDYCNSCTPIIENNGTMLFPKGNFFYNPNYGGITPNITGSGTIVTDYGNTPPPT